MTIVELNALSKVELVARLQTIAADRDRLLVERDQLHQAFEPILPFAKKAQEQIKACVGEAASGFDIVTIDAVLFIKFAALMSDEIDKDCKPQEPTEEQLALIKKLFERSREIWQNKDRKSEISTFSDLSEREREIAYQCYGLIAWIAINDKFSFYLTNNGIRYYRKNFQQN